MPRSVIAGLVVITLRGYKLLVSPFLPSECRFSPTCSEYMLGAVRMNGALQGIWMGMKRLARCHPFCEGGYDPVPDVGKRNQSPVKL